MSDDPVRARARLSLAYVDRLREWAPDERFTPDLAALVVSEVSAVGARSLAVFATWQGFDAGRAGAAGGDCPYGWAVSPAVTVARRSWFRGLALGRRSGARLASWDSRSLI